MKEYWLWSDEDPNSDEDIESYGIFEFRYKTDKEKERDEDLEDLDIGVITKVLFVSDPSLRIGVGWNSDIWEDSITEDPKRVIKFLFGKDFW